MVWKNTYNSCIFRYTHAWLGFVDILDSIFLIETPTFVSDNSLSGELEAWLQLENAA